MDKSQIRLLLIVGYWWAGILLGFHLALEVDWLVFWIAFTALLITYKLRNLLSALLWIVLLSGATLGWIRISSLQAVDLPKTSHITFEVLEDFQELQNKYDLNGEVEYRGLVDADLGINRLTPILLTINRQLFPPARIGTQWGCNAKLEKTQQIRRFVGYAECIDEPILIRNQSRLQEFANAFRIGLSEVSSARNPSAGAALLPGLVLGDTSAQSPELELDLQRAGLGHLTAVSGANVAIVLLGLEYLLQYTRLTKTARLGISALTAIFFMLIARPTPSVVRATAMALLGLVSVWFGWQRVSLVILLLSIFGLLLVDPFLSTSIGFWLSAAATFGLIVLPRFWKVSVNSNWIYKAFSTALAAGLTTLPILVAAGLSPSFVSIPANMLAEALVAPATLGGVIASLLQTFSHKLPIIGGGLTLLAEISADLAIIPASLIVLIAKASTSSFLAIAVNSAVGILLIFVSVAVFLWLRRIGLKPHWIALTVFSLISISLFINQQTGVWKNDWQIAVCDVGQGDATVLRTNQGRYVMIDVGGESELVQDCLGMLSVDELELFVASHFHADHVGAIEVLNEHSVQRVWIADSFAPIGLRELVVTSFKTAQVVTPRVGDSIQIDNLTLTVLQNPRLSSLNADGATINNASLVVLGKFPTASILFTGDIETAAQTQLMHSLKSFDVELVKVPHHGSAAQNPAFAQWTQAELGWISAGKDNPYGHPALVTVNQYRAAGITLFSTIECGTTGFKLTGAEIAIRSQKVCDAL